MRLNHHKALQNSHFWCILKYIPMDFPIRINKYLAQKGISTRAGADALIREGRVLKNGKKAVLGDHVSKNDVVEVLPGKKGAKKFSYILYYKPRGVVTHSPQKGERSIGDIAGFKDVFPVGRLDKDSEGLILLTNDGRVTERLLHPRFAHEKTYAVTVREKIPSYVNKVFTGGVRDAGENLKAKRVTVTGPHTMDIVLTEGKKHQIRRMLAHVRLTVESLIRTRIMDMDIGMLKPGESRILNGETRDKFLKEIGIPAT